MSSAAVTTSFIATGAALRPLLPRHREERAHDARAALGGGADLQRRGARGGVALLLEQHGTRDDDRQRIVELVRHAGQQRSERGQLLALVERLALPREFVRGALPLGDVARQREDAVLPADRDALDEDLVPAQLARSCCGRATRCTGSRRRRRAPSAPSPPPAYTGARRCRACPRRCRGTPLACSRRPRRPSELTSRMAPVSMSCTKIASSAASKIAR